MSAMPESRIIVGDCRLPAGLPTPAWSDETYGVALYHGDCLDILPQLPDGCVDLVLADPPYGINLDCDYRSNGCLADGIVYPNVIGDDKPFDPEPILRMDLPTILWGGNHYADRLPAMSGWLVWDKVRPHDLDQATCELAWTNVVKGVRYFRHQWHGFLRASERRENYHPTQKPVALMQWVLSIRWLTDLQTVFDPYMGSGPTGVACVNLGRAFIGIELERRYFDIAVERIRQAIIDKQGGPLFVEHEPATLFGADPVAD